MDHQTHADPGSKAELLYTFQEGKGNIVYNQVNNHNALTIPRKYSPLKYTVLQSWKEQDYSNIKTWLDIAINIFGFIVFGFLWALWLSQMKPGTTALVILLVVFSGTAISLLIEFGQVYLPSRHSSLLDLIYNMSGSLLGVVLWWIFVRNNMAGVFEGACRSLKYTRQYNNIVK